MAGWPTARPCLIDDSVAYGCIRGQRQRGELACFEGIDGESFVSLLVQPSQCAWMRIQFMLEPRDLLSPSRLPLLPPLWPLELQTVFHNQRPSTRIRCA